MIIDRPAAAVVVQGSVLANESNYEGSFFVTILAGFTSLLTLSGCTTKQPDNSQPGDSNADASLSTSQQLDPKVRTGGHRIDTTKVYSQAIRDYIRLVNKEYDFTFDTLFFRKHRNGQPEDFPDIVFPTSIDNTMIKVVSPEQGEKLRKERPSSFYINLMGWVDPGHAQFIFVTFSDGGAHQFDCFIEYEYDPSTKEFLMGITRFENFRYKGKR